MFEQRLERSPAESPLGGVCTGIANYFNIDPIFLNLAVVGLTLLGLIFLPVLYLILWLVLPVEGEVDQPLGERVSSGLSEIWTKLRSILDGVIDKLSQVGLNN